MTDIFMDERYIGNVDDVKAFIESLKRERITGKLPSSLNLYHNEKHNELHIELSKGRVRRPLIVVKNGKSLFTDELRKQVTDRKIGWKELQQQGVLEYLDAAEEENAYVALFEHDLTTEHSHLEISPTTMFGMITSLVPNANLGQSARLNRGSKTQKQSLGLYATNYHLRMDTDVSVLHYPQQPIVRTFMHDVSEYNHHPSGQNITIALMSYEGYNMSDAIIINKASIERGLARSTYYRPYHAEELRYSGGLVDEIGAPDKETKGYRSEKDYRYLEDDGIIYPEQYVKPDEILIGKTSPPRFLGEMEEFSIAANTRRESSVAVKQGENGTVDFVVITENEEGNKIVQVRLREQRIPEIGDKFASRYGQKGVIGMIVPQADMPFTVSGIIPDIIFSPHSIPSRMTVSHLIEVI